MNVFSEDDFASPQLQTNARAWLGNYNSVHLAMRGTTDIRKFLANSISSTVGQFSSKFKTTLYIH